MHAGCAPVSVQSCRATESVQLPPCWAWHARVLLALVLPWPHTPKCMPPQRCGHSRKHTLHAPATDAEPRTLGSEAYTYGMTHITHGMTPRHAKLEGMYWQRHYTIIVPLRAWGRTDTLPLQQHVRCTAHVCDTSERTRHDHLRHHGPLNHANSCQGIRCRRGAHACCECSTEHYSQPHTSHGKQFWTYKQA